MASHAGSDEGIRRMSPGLFFVGPQQRVVNRCISEENLLAVFRVFLFPR